MRFSKQLDTSLTKLQFVVVSDLSDLIALSALSSFRFQYEPVFFTTNVAPFTATPTITGTDFQFTSGTPLVIFPYNEPTENDKKSNAIQFTTFKQDKINFILPNKNSNLKNSYDSGKNTNYYLVHIQDGINSFYLSTTAFYNNYYNAPGAPNRFARAGYVISQYSDEYVTGTYNVLNNIILSSANVSDNEKIISIIPVTDKKFNTYYNTTTCISVSSDILSCISGPDNNIKCFLQTDENGDAITSFQSPGYTWISEQIVRTPAAKVTFPVFSEYCELSSLSGQTAYGWFEGPVIIKRKIEPDSMEQDNSLYSVKVSCIDGIGIPYFSQTPYVSSFNNLFYNYDCLNSWFANLVFYQLGYIDDTSSNVLNPNRKNSNTLVPAYTGTIALKETYTNPSLPFFFENVASQLSGLYYLFYNSASSLRVALDSFTMPTAYLPIYIDDDNNVHTLDINVPEDTYQKPVDFSIPPASGYFSLVDISKNNITSVNLLSSKGLVNLNLNNNALTALNLQNNYLLQTLQANFNNLTGINFNNNSFYNLQTLSVPSNQIANLNLNPCVQILNIDASNNQLTNILLLSSYKITDLNLRNNQLQFNELKNIVNTLSSVYSLNVTTDFTQNPGYNQTIIDLMNSSTNNAIGNGFIRRSESLYNNSSFACGDIGNGSLGVGYNQGIVTTPINTNKDLSFVAIENNTKVGLLQNNDLYYAGNKHSLRLTANITTTGTPPNLTTQAVTAIAPGTSTSLIFLPITSIPSDPQLPNNLKFDKATLDKNTCYLLSSNAMYAFGKDTNLQKEWNTTLDFNLQPLTGQWVDIVSGPNATVALSTNNAAFMRFNSNATWSNFVPYYVFGTGYPDGYSIINSFTHTSKLGFLSGAALGDSYCCLLSSNGIIWITGFINDGTDFNYRKDYTGSLYNTLSAQLLNGTVINNLESKFDRIVGGNNKFFALSGKQVFMHGSSTPDNALQRGQFITSFIAVPSSFDFYTGSDVSVIAVSGAKAYAVGTQRSNNLGTGGRDVTNGWYPLTGEWKSISVGYDHAMALDLSGRMYAVGSNVYGQFGNYGWGYSYDTFTGPFYGYYYDHPPFTGGLKFETVKCGFWHTFALSGLSADALFQTGRLPWGGFDQVKDLPLPGTQFVDFGQRVQGSFKDISCFYSSALLLSSTGGALYATGKNDKGQLGLGDNTTRYGWTSGTFTCDKIATGYLHSAALTGNKVYTTGDNSFGQLGIGNNDNKNIWTVVPGDFTDIKCTSNTTFALSNNGIWMAAGYAANGSMGQELSMSQYNYFIPISSFDKLNLTNSDYLFAQKNNKTYFSGPNGFGQSGTGKGAVLKNLLYQVPSFTNKNVPLEIDSVACGLSHTVFLTGNSVYACGDNSYGQCGSNNTSTVISVPTQIPGSYKKIYAGYNSTYLISSFPA